MNIILLGPPGVGKGTLADNLSKKFSIAKISTGDIFRDAVRQGTGLGRKAKGFMDKGNLVPDDIVIGIVNERLQKDDCKNGYILDGFPRTTAQAEALDNIAKTDIALNIKAADETIVERVSSRRLCKKCQSGFNIITLKPKKEGICDNCGGKLIQREDDKPETVRKRLEVYRKQTSPLIEYYSKKGILKNVDGEPSIEEVFNQTVKIINNIN